MTLVKKISILFLITLFIITLFIFSWQYLTNIRVEDKNLSDFNAGQRCVVDSDCGKSGCGGEICGNGGPATICYQSPDFWIKFKERSCSCLQNQCKWSRPLIESNNLVSLVLQYFKQN